MYIAPNTSIKILQNVPLDSTYDHTIYFSPNSAGNTAQYNYFVSKTKYNLSEQTYQRVKRGWLRVGVVADNLYDCNYMMFQNTNFGSKWFYAFIKSVEYINNAVSEIEFEIDVMQTWNSEYTLDQCFVEREHMATGDTLPLFTDEGLNVGTTIYGDYETIDMNEMNIVILSSPKNGSSGHIYFNTYNRVSVSSIIPVTNNNIPSIDSVIDQIVAANETIIAIYQYPRIFETGAEGATRTITKQITKPAYVDGSNPYIPKNKKLLYYPYSFIRLSSQNGKYQDYAYEYFDENEIQFNVKCVTIPQTNVIVYPLNYKNMPECFEENMIISNFPVCAWSTSGFEQWWANNKWSIFADGICGAIDSSDNTDKSLNASASISLLSNVLQATNLPNNVHGNLSTSNINAGLNKQAINFYPMSLKRERAIIIDEFFDRYGYATNRNKIPNRNVRPHWCYTKTANCSITGSLPSDDVQKICQIYNHGITFWKNGSEVCNYSLDNTINEG